MDENISHPALRTIGEGREISGLVLEVQRFSTDDGPGIRTTVFMKGCPLSCQWCHNPESISPLPQVQWLGIGCLRCGDCLAACPNMALDMTEVGIVIERSLCKGCGNCAQACPSAALVLLGRRYQLKELLAELIKDRVYFEHSGGGVTISGGEAALQYPFVAALAQLLREEGIHTALDTAGCYSSGVLSELLPFFDLLLFDLKVMDNERHKEFTGRGNEQILARAQEAARFAAASEGRLALWVRTPIIPQASDDEANIREIGAFIADILHGIPLRWELCAFNNLCRDKYLRLGKEWKYREAELISRSTMERLAEVARASGVPPAIVHWSGSVSL